MEGRCKDRRNGSELRRAQILCAAKTCFSECGFHGTSMADLSKSSGMSAGLIYHYFHNKETIVAAIVRSQVEHITGLLEALRGREDATKELASLFGSLLAELDRNTARLHMEILAEAGRSPRIGSIVREADTRLRQTLLALLSEEPSCLSVGKDDIERASLRVDLLMAVMDRFVVCRATHPESGQTDVHRLVSAALR